MSSLRVALVKIDSKFLNSSIKNYYRIRVTPKLWHLGLKQLREWNSISIGYSNKSRTQLNALCQKYNTDKGSLAPTRNDHAYADFYDLIFSGIRESTKLVFECGIGSNNSDINGFMGIDASPGASLRVWREYFSNAKIFGADIDNRILFKEERINTFFVDQTDPSSIQSLWQEVEKSEKGEFDVIIDDGLHTFAAATTFFSGSIHKLRVSGFFIIEDLEFEEMVKLEQVVDTDKFSISYVKFQSSERGIITGTLTVIKRLQ